MPDPTPRLDAARLRRLYLDFFAERGHARLPSASLVPDNDPSALFTTAGMQPLAPYLLGQDHAAGTRLANCQRCCRTRDIDEVGDTTHLTVFEMLGNWSLGEYGRREMIPWSWEFLTGDGGLGLDPRRLYVTFFAGDQSAPKDEESLRLWQGQFGRAGIRAAEGERLFALGREDNWWGPVLYITVYTLRPIILFPASVLTVLGGLAFGPVAGVAYTMIGSNLSTAATYAGARFVVGVELAPSAAAEARVKELAQVCPVTICSSVL